MKKLIIPTKQEDSISVFEIDHCDSDQLIIGKILDIIDGFIIYNSDTEYWIYIRNIDIEGSYDDENLLNLIQRIKKVNSLIEFFVQDVSN